MDSEALHTNDTAAASASLPACRRCARPALVCGHPALRTRAVIGGRAFDGPLLSLQKRSSNLARVKPEAGSDAERTWHAALAGRLVERQLVDVENLRELGTRQRVVAAFQVSYCELGRLHGQASISGVIRVRPEGRSGFRRSLTRYYDSVFTT